MLHDLIFNRPEMLFAGCIAWLVVAAWTLMLVHRMIMQDVDVLTGTVGIGTVVGLGFMAIHPPKPFLQPLSISVLFLSGLAIPIVRKIYHVREMRSSEIEGVHQAYEGFVLRPNNPSAQIRLARHLYNLGVRGHAMVLAEGALPGLPRRFFPDEYRMVDQWRQYPLPKSEFDPIACVECGTRNVPGTIHCTRCGARYLLDRVRGKAVSKTFGRRLLAAWLVMVFALVGIPLAAAVGGVVALILIAVLTLASVVALVMAFRTGEPAT